VAFGGGAAQAALEPTLVIPPVVTLEKITVTCGWPGLEIGVVVIPVPMGVLMPGPVRLTV
jgi:hypothetical protein